MQRRSTAGDLIPIDLEINATCRRCNSERIKKFLQDLEETVEDPIIVEKPRRVTLEDYSSSTVPQFFTSMAQPKVQAQIITYPPSLI